MKNKFASRILLALGGIMIFLPGLVYGNGLPDADKDGVPDEDELNIYFTEMNKFDTDGDGYGDGEELRSGYSPFEARKIKLEYSDYDADGLTDRMEFKYKTNPTDPDTDKDGYKDGDEVKYGFDPLKGDGARMVKKIEINLARQELGYFYNEVRLGVYPVSSGSYNRTPKGNFKIGNKLLKAWSPYGLWMPYWLGIEGQRFGIHELPIWPSGYREGTNHLGYPVSHGCIRLGIGPAKTLYDWAEMGTLVNIN